MMLQREGMAMNVEKKKSFLIHAAYYAAIIGIALIAIRYLLRPLLPFIIGFFVAWILQRPAKAISRKFHLYRRISALLLGAAFYSIVFIAAVTAGVQVISALENLVPQLPALYANIILPLMTNAFDKLDVYLANVDPEIVEIVEKMISQLLSYMSQLVSTLSVTAVRLASSLITSLPSIILSIILTVISTFFIALDFDNIIGFVKRAMPTNVQSTVSQTVTTGVSSIRKILISYILILLLSFAELSLGLLILRVPYAVGIALMIAVMDIMPILGTGLVLIPWALIAGVMRNVRMAVGIGLLYIIMVAVRNVVEPKLVGSQMGLHPLVTLISMFVGLQLFGIVGLFGFPISLSLYIKLTASQKTQSAS